MTEKENYLRLLRGEEPEWVPVMTMAPNPFGYAPPSAMVAPAMLSDHFYSPEAAKDVWGVNYIPVAEAGGAKIPDPYNRVLDDITKWRDVIKAPDVSGVDWEAQTKKELDKLNIDRNETALSFGAMCSPFLTLVALMGFEDGLSAMYEEPEEVYAMLEYITDFYYMVGEKCIDYYKPDLVAMADDIATWLNPFFSLDIYRRLIKPHHARIAKLATDRGIPVDMHCCGRGEDFIDDWMDFGVVSWNPAQTSNDLLAVKKKYGRKLLIVGAWDALDELCAPDISEEKVKASVYETIDKYAPGGGYAFSGGFLGSRGDNETAKKNRWLVEAATEYGRTFYKKN